MRGEPTHNPVMIVWHIGEDFEVPAFVGSVIGHAQSSDWLRDHASHPDAPTLPQASPVASRAGDFRRQPDGIIAAPMSILRNVALSIPQVRRLRDARDALLGERSYLAARLAECERAGLAQGCSPFFHYNAAFD